MGSARRRRRAASAVRDLVRDRSRTLPRPGPRDACPGRARHRGSFVEHDRCGPRSRFLTARSRDHSGWALRARGVHDADGGNPRARARAGGPVRRSYAAQRALDLSWTRTQVELRDLGISPSDAALYQELAGHLLYGHPALRPSPPSLASARASLPALWAMGLSGDWPILLAMIEAPEGLPTVRQLLDAHNYLRLKGMTFDLVLVNTRPASYLQELNDTITTTVMASPEAGLDRPRRRGARAAAGRDHRRGLGGPARRRARARAV